MTFSTVYFAFLFVVLFGGCLAVEYGTSCRNCWTTPSGGSATTRPILRYGGHLAMPGGKSDFSTTIASISSITSITSIATTTLKALGAPGNIYDTAKNYVNVTGAYLTEKANSLFSQISFFADLNATLRELPGLDTLTQSYKDLASGSLSGPLGEVIDAGMGYYGNGFESMPTLAEYIQFLFEHLRKMGVPLPERLQRMESNSLYSDENGLDRSRLREILSNAAVAFGQWIWRVGKFVSSYLTPLVFLRDHPARLSNLFKKMSNLTSAAINTSTDTILKKIGMKKSFNAWVAVKALKYVVETAAPAGVRLQRHLDLVLYRIYLLLPQSSSQYYQMSLSEENEVLVQRMEWEETEWPAPWADNGTAV